MDEQANNKKEDRLDSWAITITINIIFFVSILIWPRFGIIGEMTGFFLFLLGFIINIFTTKGGPKIWLLKSIIYYIIIFFIFFCIGIGFLFLKKVLPQNKFESIIKYYPYGERLFELEKVGNLINSTELTNPINERKTYVNDVYDFKFDYPSNYNVKLDTDYGYTPNTWDQDKDLILLNLNFSVDVESDTDVPAVTAISLKVLNTTEIQKITKNRNHADCLMHDEIINNYNFTFCKFGMGVDDEMVYHIKEGKAIVIAHWINKKIFKDLLTTFEYKR